MTPAAAAGTDQSVGTVLVLAHGVGSRADLPVPVCLAIFGAAIAVIASFAAF